MKFQIYFILFLIIVNCQLSIVNCSAQDIHFSQPWMTPLLQNPAMAGANHDMQVILNYKNQWASVESPFKTYGASVDRRLYDRVRGRRSTEGFFAAGLNAYSDEAGDSKMGTLQLNLSGAYHSRLDFNNILSAGLMLGYMQRSINYSGLQWMNQYDGMKYNPNLPSLEPTAPRSLGVPDLGAGLAWTYSKGEAYMTSNDFLNINIGFAAFHPHQPAYSYYKSDESLRVKWVGHGNAIIGIRETMFSVVPGFMYYRQGKLQELNFGCMGRYMLKEDSRITGYIQGAALSLGAYYRNKDALIAHAMLEFGQYALGISYDANTSDLRTASNGFGSIEVSLRWVQWRWFYYKKA